MNRRDACLLLARRYPGGVEALAPRLGFKPDTLRKALTAVPGYKFDIDDEELLMSLCQAAGVANALAPLTASAANHGAMVLPLPRLVGDDSSPHFRDLARAARESAEFVAVFAEASEDDRFTPNECKRLEREGAELIASVQTCLQHAKEKCEAAKPANLRAVGGG